MKALITAGGHATRLRPLTWNRNKHLIPLAGKPMLHYAIERIVRAGITDIGINVNLGDIEIAKIFGNGAQCACRITYIEQCGGARGLGHVIKNAYDVGFLNDEPFLMYLGDNLLCADLSAFITRFINERANCMLMLAAVPDPERFGVAEIIDNKIVRVEEKPMRPKSNFAIAGIYLYDHHARDAVKEMKPSARGEFEITDVHQYYIDQGLRVGHEEITGWWKDTGKPEDLLLGNQFILDDMHASSMCVHPSVRVGSGVSVQGKVSVGEGSIILENTVIRGPVVIGKNARISGSFIGPYTSIGNSVEIGNSEIEHSIVFDNAYINCDARLIDGIIGAHTKIISSRNIVPRTHRLLVGDNSVIEL